MMDGLEHVIENGIEELLRFLGIAIRYDPERPDDVREKHGDLFALALEIALRRHYPGGEMFRSVVVGRQEAVYRTMLPVKADRMCALRTELGSWRNHAAAIGAAVSKRSGTLLAEFRFKPIVVFAPRTLHLNRQLAVGALHDILLWRIAYNNRERRSPALADHPLSLARGARAAHLFAGERPDMFLPS
jgi:hypothetical protein